MPTLQRPTEAANALFWRAPRGALPDTATLVVAATECVVASRDGSVLGVIAPGTYTMDPASFPFLAAALDASANVAPELCFVSTADLRGLRFGGPVGALYDPGTACVVSPTVTGDCSIRVVDPPLFVQASLGMADADAVYAALAGMLLGRTKEAIGRIAAEGVHLTSSDATRRLAAELPGLLGELGALGLSLRALQTVNLAFSEQDRAALAAKAKAQRDAKLAEIAQRGAGVAESPPPVALPAAVATGDAGGGASVSAAPRGKGRLLVGLALAAIVVVSVVIGVAMNLGRSDPPAAPQRDGRHGKR